jgi:hypothetical protein
VTPFKGAYRIAAFVAAIHLVCVALTAWYVSAEEQTSGQAVLVWAIWLLIDFPVSFLGYFLFEGQFFLVHAVIGSLWWFFLAVVVTRIVQAIRRRFA